MPTTNDVVSNMVAALQITEPDLDTSIGSVARKMLDAVGAQIAESFSDQHLINYAYDIDSKTAGDLDDFCALFSIAREQAQRATGVVTFTRPASVAATRTASIPTGTQVLAMTSPPVYVQTLTSAVMAIAQTSVDLPVQAIVAGPQGNVSAGLLVNLASSVDGVTACTNNAALAYGSNAETDDQLRARWKSTALRNLAGTEAMYRAMALQTQSDPADPTSRAVTQCNVLGSKKTWSEQVAVVSGSASTSLTDAAYIYPRSVYVGSNIASGLLLTPNTQYTATINNSASPATLSIATVGVNMPDGIYDLQFDYVPSFSRNDPMATRWGIAGAYVSDRIDLWVNGIISRIATQACTFNSGSTQRFNSVPSDPMNLNRYTTRIGTHPASNDVFVPLGFGPIVSVPASLTIGGTTYNQGTHYDLVHQSDAFGYAPNSRFGLIWYAAGPMPASNSAFSITYPYNAVPLAVQTAIESGWRLLGTDVWVHAGVAVPMRLNVALVYERNVDQNAVNSALAAALSSFINALGFNAAMQISDLVQVMHNVAGVDNIRFLNSTDDGTNYAVQSVKADGSYNTPYNTGGRAIDHYFDDASYPVYNSIRIVTKAKNTFGTP